MSAANNSGDELLARLPDLIAARIHLALPALRQCNGMVGGFDVDELKRQGMAAPAVLVSRLGTTPMSGFAGPHPRFAVAMAAFIVTRDALGLKRDIAMSNIVGALLRLIPDACWSHAGVGPADQVQERVLINREARQITAALAAVTWRQPVTLNTLPAANVLPIELYVGDGLDPVEAP